MFVLVPMKKSEIKQFYPPFASQKDRSRKIYHILHHTIPYHILQYYIQYLQLINI